MAHIQENLSKRPTRQRKHSTLVDFTSMVDLGFLLITFFMLTTSLSKPNVMPLVMPDSDGCYENLKASKAITFLLGEEDAIYWYEGIFSDSLQQTDYGKDGLRTVLLDKKERVRAVFPDFQKEKMDGGTRDISHVYAIIKPLPGARYKNTVDALDEMAICGVSFYTIMECSPEEIALAKRYSQ